MTDIITAEERNAFRAAYNFLNRHHDPLCYLDEEFDAWWESVGKDISEICGTDDQSLRWFLLIAVMDYMNEKAKKRSKELEDFV